jgi:hypothetical protein
MLKNISNEENLLDESENKINKLKKMQAITLSYIDKDLVRHFNEFVNRLQPEIIEVVMEFFGFSQTPRVLLKVRKILIL